MTQTVCNAQTLAERYPSDRDFQRGADRCSGPVSAGLCDEHARDSADADAEFDA